MTRTTLLAAAAALSLGGCSTIADLPTEELGSATLSLSNGTPVGTARLVANGDDVSLAVAVTAIPAGAHGFHLHTTGKCEAPGFTSAGGHLNPLDREHGSENPQGKHFGDLPNLAVGSNRSAATTIDLPGTRAQALSYIFDADGTAVIIHAGADDYRSDPAGDAGSRLACGVMSRS